jgi:hypothetical protein
MKPGLLIAATAVLIAAGIVVAIHAGRSQSGSGNPAERLTDAGVPAPAMPTLRQVVVEAAVHRVRRAEIAKEIAKARAGKRNTGQLTKDDVRGSMRLLVPLLGGCYSSAQARDARLGGVVNTLITIDSEPDQGTVVTVRGFDTAGPLGESRAFRECVRDTLEAAVLPPIAGGGTLEATYPITFAPRPPDNRDTELFGQAEQAVAHGRWAQALIKAEQGLKSTSIDGTFRRRLIEVAGLASCHLKRDGKARHYFALASARVERVLRETCARFAQILLRR